MQRELNDIKVNSDQLKAQNEKLIEQIAMEKQQMEDIQNKYKDTLSTMMEKDGK